MQIQNLSAIPAGTTTPAGSTAASSSASAASSSGLNDPNLFITLLTAQLQAQDPLDPISPEDMVNQLTQVSSLQQLININQTLTTISNAGGSLGTNPAPAPTPAGSAANPSS